jgi:amphi-Trp domain-containing protein
METSNNVTKNESGAFRVEYPESPADGQPQADKGKGKIKFKSKMQRDEVVHYFEAVATGLRKGRLQFRQGDDLLVLTPGEAGLKIEMKAEKKDGKERLSFELSWHTETEGEEADEDEKSDADAGDDSE